MVCTGADDDNLDIDWGYQGRLQYVIVQQSNDKGDHIVESDNTNSDATVGYLTEPRSNPIVSNFTFISKGHDDIFKLKEGVAGQYYNGIAVVRNNVTGKSTNCIETTKTETVQAGAITGTFSMNSVAMDCPGYIKTNDGVEISAVDAIVKSGQNNLYAATSGGGTYVNTLSGVVNGSTEAAAIATAIPEIYNADGFFDATSYIGAVNGSTDNWYKNWTLSGTIEVQ